MRFSGILLGSSGDIVARVADVLAPQGYVDAITLSLVAAGSIGLWSRGVLWDRPDPYAYKYYERPQERLAGAVAKHSRTRDISKHLRDADKDLVIFWGSQSGIAEGFASRLARECHLRFGFKALSADLSDYDAHSVAHLTKDKLVIFILSTFGEGDPSDNATGFLEWIRKGAIMSNRLTDLRYAAFGLGNSNYKYYNQVARVAVSALEKMGAQSILPLGLADDATGATKEDFLAWKKDLFSCFRTTLSIQEREAGYLPSVSVTEDYSLDPINVHDGEPHCPEALKGRSSAAKSLLVKSSKELFSASAGRNCVHIELDLSEHRELRYKTGDHVAIWPVNPDADVDVLLEALGMSGRRTVPLIVKPVDSTCAKTNIPSPTTIGALFSHYLEINAPLSRETVAALVQFAPSAKAKSFLQSISADKDSFAALQTVQVLTFGRLLHLASDGRDEEWRDLPLSFAVESLPAMQPRYYSISSSSVVNPRSVAVTAVVTAASLANPPKKEVEEAQVLRGLASNYLLAQHAATTRDSHPAGLTYTPVQRGSLAQALEEIRVFASLHKSKFRLPALASHPLVMVCAGTGIAPFRAFLLERARLHAMGRPVGRMLLFYGCRHPDHDWLYRDELEAVQQQLDGQLDIVTCFSRLPGQPKTHVQHRLQDPRWGPEVATLLVRHDAAYYCCGSASMAREAARAVRTLVAAELGWSADLLVGLTSQDDNDDNGDGDNDGRWRAWSEARRRAGRWHEDVWG